MPVVIASAHPHLQGICFALPAVQPIFDEFVARQGLADRIRFQSGNFFDDPMLDADVIGMGHILHDWIAEKLLEKAFAALPNGGGLNVYDAVIEDQRRSNAFGLLLSLNMLIETRGDFDYTGADCQASMRDADFVSTRVEPLLGRIRW